MKFNISATAIIYDYNYYNDLVFLITQRPKTKKKFPGLWTVPGGKIEKEDIKNGRNVGIFAYDVLDNTTKREVLEETGAEIIGPIKYLTSIVYGNDEDLNMVISFYGRTNMIDISPEFKTKEIEAIAWVTVDDLNKYNFIEGIADEIREVARRLENERNHN